MEFFKKLFQFFAVLDNKDKLRNPLVSPPLQAAEKSGELTREQLTEILQWLSYY